MSFIGFYILRGNVERKWPNCVYAADVRMMRNASESAEFLVASVQAQQMLKQGFIQLLYLRFYFYSWSLLQWMQGICASNSVRPSEMIENIRVPDARKM